MLEYPEIDPVLISLGPLKIHWYGAMYAIAFVVGWWLALRRISKHPNGWTADAVNDLLFYLALGVLIGGRLGYVLFYGLGDAIADPLSIFKVWQGGMSFHGGALGVIVAMSLFARKTGRHPLQVLDFVGPFIPIGLFFGRVGNFINAELWGKPSDLPWAMRFPNDEAGLYRHPSMLYEAALEGIVLFLVLWIYSRKPRAMGAVTGLGLLLYGVFRCFVEFFRVPDSHIGDGGYLAFGWLTMGQLLSLPMIAVGAWLLWRAGKRALVA